MASSAIGVNAGGSANEAPKIPDNVGDWLRGVYSFATSRNDFRRNLILNLGLFSAGVWLARNLSDIDLMASQPGLQPNRHMEPVLYLTFQKEPPICDHPKTCRDGSWSLIQTGTFPSLPDFLFFTESTPFSGQQSGFI